MNSGGPLANMLATIVILMKWKCTHSNQSVSASIVLLMKWKLEYAPSKSRNGGNMSTKFVLLMKLKYALSLSESKVAGTCQI